MNFNRASLSFIFAALTTSAIAGDNYLVYFGCYTNAKSGSKGIYVSKFSSGTGELSDPELAVETGSPSFLAISADKKHLYAVGEMPVPGSKAGGVSAFNISLPEGKLSPINQVSSVGVGPCHVSLDHTGEMAMIANYGSGSVASYAIGQGGELSEAVSFMQHEGSSVDPKRQAGPHGHSINASPDNQFALACDLGLDKVLIYKIDPERGSLMGHGHATVPPGSGPRHLAFHPNGKFVFVNNEMLMTVTSFAYQATKGAMTEIETVSTLPEADRGKQGYSTAETVAHPNGKFVYVSNRTHDTIAVFSCDPATGKLTLIQNAPAEGEIPRNFCLDPSGRWMIVAHQNSNTAALFKVDTETGKLAFTGKKVKVGGAVCVRFLALD
ncbi:6-phosphogluconolactonase [Prosthecobacter debontii]|uniref:6-phosphogluconolactonase n=1 Tax=Prosthecobacter debontii TaxID=48467 RepID=A0A1T4XYT9_9BACT|nr:lactonase family protein [Prosthecobacter debontii]SKA94211.1 6-phosphogluconolactonase [Prosthecobacter debontii]